MAFTTFKNQTDYLEYLQIFCFANIIVNKKKNFSIDDYEQFELTDVLINQYNKWIAQNTPDSHLISNWFEANEDLVENFKCEFGLKYAPKVAIWSDREKTGYYKTKLQDSFIFENYIADLVQSKYGVDIGPFLTPEGQYELGENALGIEIKNDTLIEKYGNVYIEYQEKSNSTNNDYINSGILKNDNCKYFLIGTKAKFYIFRKSRLVEIYHEENSLRHQGKVSKRGIHFKNIATSRAYVYPVRLAIQDTISFSHMMNEILFKP